jgi:hypothetical protein
MLAYHDEEPDAEMRPIFIRCSNLTAHKRAISNFMPRQLMKWDPVTNIGNLTMSKRVTKVIAKVKKFEVFRQGTSTQVQRPIESDEFLNVLDIIRNVLEEDDDLKRSCMASVLCCQWQMIGRIDNMMKLQLDCLGINHNHPGTAQPRFVGPRTLPRREKLPIRFWLGVTTPRGALFCLLLCTLR